MHSTASATLKSIARIAGDKTSVRRKTIVGSQWLLTRSILRSCVDLIKTAIFARILFPGDYGLMALAIIPIGLLESFSVLGIEIMIQRDDNGYRERLPAYWTIRFVRGWILFALIWWAAIPLGEYYQKTELIPLVRFLGLMFLFDGMAGFGREVRQREMAFSRIVMLDSLAAVVVLLVGLIFLFIFRNYWALAIYSVLNSFFLMIGSYIIFPWKPSFRICKSIFKALAAFSGSLILISVLNYFFNNFDKGIIGKIFGLEQLGFYSRAYFLALIPVANFFNALAPVMLNAFRKVSDNPDRLKKAFQKSALSYCILAFSMGAVLFLFSQAIIGMLYGEKWLPVIPIFRILIFYGVSKGIATICPPIFFIKNKPWMITLSTALMVGSFGMVCLPMTITYGTAGTAWAVVIAGLISHSFSFFLVFRAMNEAPNNRPRHVR